MPATMARMAATWDPAVSALRPRMAARAGRADARIRIGAIMGAFHLTSNTLACPLPLRLLSVRQHSLHLHQHGRPPRPRLLTPATMGRTDVIRVLVGNATRPLTAATTGLVAVRRRSSAVLGATYLILGIPAFQRQLHRQRCQLPHPQQHPPNRRPSIHATMAHTDATEVLAAFASRLVRKLPTETP
jgi:hypothetical protein